MEIIFDEPEISVAAGKFLEIVKPHKIFAFSGELGAGKTAFITALCRHMHVQESVTSPTYSIIQEYHSEEGFIYHMDLYRLKDAREAMDAGVEDYLQSGYICMVEWPERAPEIFPSETVFCKLNIAASGKRILVVELPR